MFIKESILTVLVSKKPVALSVGSINVVMENSSVEVKNESLTYEIHGNTNEEVSFLSKLIVILCRLRLAILVKKGVRVQTSALARKYKRHLRLKILKGV